MTGFIVAFILLGLFHYVYQSILLPTVHIILRQELEEINYRLFLLNHREKISDTTYEFVSSGVLRLRDNMESMSLFDRKIYSSNQKALNESKKINEFIRNSPEEIQEIDKELNIKYKFLLVSNSGGWLFYLLPLAVVIFVFLFLTHTFRSINNYFPKGNLYSPSLVSE